MRAVVQRVSRAAVSVAEEQIAQIGSGLLVLLGVQMGDSEQDAQYLADKLAKLRIFEDAQGKMNLSIKDVGGQALLVSQFTLLGDARGQNRPGFTQAEEPERANALYEYCCERLAVQGVPVHRGRFRSHMALSLINDGPVTLLLDSRKEF
jgi:D-tyrosyl-tRNA(Tyr) deacylase